MNIQRSIFLRQSPQPDIEIIQNNRTLKMLGTGGAEREYALLGTYTQHAKQPVLPVLLGSGMGYALEELLHVHSGALAVVDKETDILALTKLRSRFSEERIFWITAHDPQEITAQIRQWQKEQHNLPLLLLQHPFYARLDKAFYQQVQNRLATPPDIWQHLKKPRFVSKTPRLLLLTSRYFLMGELVGACTKLGIPHRLLVLENDEQGTDEFIENLLTQTLDFQPDCIITLNHLGVDREGVLMQLLEKMQLPLASWFLDNPQLILHLYDKLVSPWVALFTWDLDTIPALRQSGFEHVFYLPLCTDPARFTPRPRQTMNVPEWKAPLSFVGNSMVYKVAGRMQAFRFNATLLRHYRDIAARFNHTDERSIRDFLRAYSPDIVSAYDALDSNEARLGYEALLTWEATRQYRLSCIQQIIPFHPLIVGDKGWKQLLRTATSWRYYHELAYYDELPQFYLHSAVNFNCTSKQMKGAVNQRVFDVPAAGAFVLSDWRVQIEALFELGKEAICFREPEEAPELVKYYLNHEAERMRIAHAGHARVLAEHTWEHRLTTLLAHMHDTFGSI